MTIHQNTLFEAVGGSDGVLRLARAWHERVLADEVVSHAFSHGYHPRHTERLAAYWGEAWGGPTTYTQEFGSEASVVRMHSGNGVHAEMDQRAIDCFALALEDIGLQEGELRKILLDYFTWATRGPMAAYPDGTENIPDNLPLRKWGWTGLKG